jgi:sucrose-6-phosphate hydrolase SacC (GH32 family)
VDWNNTLGLQTGVEKTIAVFYTDYGRGTSIAYSPDAGKTWIRHKDNPVIPLPESGQRDRDALVFWYKPDQSWRLVLYERPNFTFYKSTDLINWEFLSTLGSFHECPDLMQLPIDGDENNKKWVLIEANALYLLGDFNGTEFIPETDKLEVDYGNLYATQSWKQSYEGDGPVIQLSMISFPGQTAMHDRTWSMQQCFPCELTLKTINGEVRLCRNPIVGIKKLRYESHFWENENVDPGNNPLADLDGDVFEINAVIDPGKASEFGFSIRGEKLVYSVQDQLLTFMEKEAKLLPMTIGSDEKIKISLIIDRGSVEVFANQGEVSISMLFYPDPSDMNLEFFSAGGSAVIDYMEAYRLESIWLKREQELGYYRSSEGK